MVGVPKSIGCDACRKQKKKCTVDERPPCQRCQRLGIECKGYGLQRFIFKHNTPTRDSKSRSHSPPTANNTDLVLQQRTATKFVHTPSTGTDSLAASLVRCLDREFKDPRYHLTWIFGGFLYSVPMYLGTNPSLDSAVSALVASYTHFRHGGGSVDATSLNLYTKALGDLRLSLGTTEAACAPTTLCAIMIMMIVETLVGGVNALHHAGGAARILKSRGMRPPQDELEHNILATLRGPVAFQAFHLDEGYFTDAEWDHIMELPPSGTTNHVMTFFAGFSGTARLFQRLRRALLQGDHVRVQELMYRAWGLREQIKKQNTQTLNQLYGASRLPENLNVFQRVNHTRNCGLLLSTQIILNCMIASIETMQRDALMRENSTLGRATCKLAMDVECDRPLGSLWVCLMLSLAYIGAESVEDKDGLNQLLQYFVSDVQTDKELWSVEQAEKLRDYITFRNLAGLEVDGSRMPY